MQVVGRFIKINRSELRIVPLGSSISLTVRQRGKAIYSVFFLGGSSSMIAVLATILMSDPRIRIITEADFGPGGLRSNFI